MMIDETTDEVLDQLNEGSFDTQAIDENFEFSSEDTTESDLQTSGMVDQPGGYHFEVEKVEQHLKLITDDGKEQTPHVLITCKVLQTTPGQSPEGSVLFHRIYVAQKDGSPPKKGSVDAMQRFAYGLGLMQWAEVQRGESRVRKLCSTATGKPSLKISEFSDAVGLQFVAVVKREKSNDARYDDRFVIPMGRACRPSAAEVQHIPKNKQKLIEGGYVSEHSSEPASNTQTSQPQTSQPQQGQLVPDDQPATSTTAPEEFDLASL